MRRRPGPSSVWALAALAWLGLTLSAAGADTAPPLTTETLGRFLRELGLQPSTIESASGGTWGYGITAKRGGRTFRIEVQVSGDEQTVWVIAPLRMVPNPQKLPAARLLRLLQENDSIGPAAFAYGDGQFYLNLPLPNHGLTAARFRSDLEALFETIQRTEPLWNPAQWGSTPTLSGGAAKR